LILVAAAGAEGRTAVVLGRARWRDRGGEAGAEREDGEAACHEPQLTEPGLNQG
ncbi:MAG: hypothetical protein JWO33_1697, partial [Caulobacteraceae bacterium]|nr:hypothetical protein [Caulobacteraceae bacterium]